MSAVKRKREDEQKPLVEKLRELPREERKKRIEQGRATFRNIRLHASGHKLLLCNACIIVGDNNNVRGNNNFIYGENNKADGTGNVLKPRSEYKREGVPASTAPVPTPPPPQIVATSTSNPSLNFSEMPLAAQIIIGSLLPMGMMQRPIEQPKPPEAAVEKFVPKPGSAPEQNKWKTCLLDLTGDPTATEVEELRCVICMENRKDTMFMPCNHICCCRSCARMLYNPDKKAKCPECRTAIDVSSIVFT